MGEAEKICAKSTTLDIQQSTLERTYVIIIRVSGHIYPVGTI